MFFFLGGGSHCVIHTLIWAAPIFQTAHSPYSKNYSNQLSANLNFHILKQQIVHYVQFYLRNLSVLIFRILKLLKNKELSFIFPIVNFFELVKRKKIFALGRRLALLIKIKNYLKSTLYNIIV